MTKWIYGFDELCKEHDNIVGKKCANLGEMTRVGFRVPPGFALALEAYNRFMKETGAIEEIRQYLSTFSADPNRPADMAKYDKASEVIRGIVESKEMPEDMKEVIRQYYDQLCRTVGISDIPVATRSAGPVSHPGQYDSYLYIRGSSSVIENIIKVWSSTFNQRALIGRASLELPLEYDPIGVAVLKMVNARAAGVMFTLNPLNGDPSKVVIEASWGLGEAVVSGSVSPDKFVVDKVMLSVLEKSIGSKSTEYIQDNVTKQVVKRETDNERQGVACLSDDEIINLARVGKTIEHHFGQPQDIEWAFDRDMKPPDNLFILQSRQETVWSSRKREPIRTESSYIGYLANRIIEGW